MTNPSTQAFRLAALPRHPPRLASTRSSTPSPVSSTAFLAPKHTSLGGRRTPGWTDEVGRRFQDVPGSPAMDTAIGERSAAESSAAGGVRLPGRDRWLPYLRRYRRADLPRPAEPVGYTPAMEQMYHPDDLATMDPLVLMKNLDHVRMTSRRLSYILQQQVHLYTSEANRLREQIDRYVEAERQIEGEMARRRIRA
jgi:hypothetical protein